MRLTSGAGSRAAKYRHLLDRELQASDAELSLLAVLLLRGPQTPGELKPRTERLHAFSSLDEVETTLAGLVTRELVARRERRPGQKEDRYEQLLGESAAQTAPETGGDAPPKSAAAATGSARSSSGWSNSKRICVP